MTLGLRSGEGRRLRWKDVDFDNGILTIRKAKNRKQRFAPIDISLTKTLRDYRQTVLREKICGDFLFESDWKKGKPFSKSTFYFWFMKVLKKADIKYARKNQNERGICPHCLRHTFTHKSFLNAENNGVRFEDYAPFLSAYLGHDSPVETEKYLRSDYTIYTQSHQRIDAAVGNLFPEVCFDEE